MNPARIASCQSERGYTLLETLVAMSIFVGILLPTVSVLGNFMFDPYPDTYRAALAEGQSEMNRVITQHDYLDVPQGIAGRLKVARRIARDGELLDILITVSTATKPSRELITLHKSVLAVQ